MTWTRFSLDSNVLVYAVDAGSPQRCASAQQILDLASQVDCTLTLQAIGEFFQAVTRKRIVARPRATELVRTWLRLFPIAQAAPADMLAAVDASNAGRFQFYDALLLATADASGCNAVISEDMADGAKLGGVEVVAAFDAAGGIGPRALALLT